MALLLKHETRWCENCKKFERHHVYVHPASIVCQGCGHATGMNLLRMDYQELARYYRRATGVQED